MSTVSNQTSYVGNWRGELTATINGSNSTATTVTPTLTAAIGRKGTGTLVTATFSYDLSAGTASAGTTIHSGSVSLSQSGWTSSNQSRNL